MTHQPKRGAMLASELNHQLIKHDETHKNGLMTDLQKDIHLAHRIAAKDEDGLAELYDVYGRRLYAYALRLTGDQAQAEDILQDALIAIWHSAKNYRGDGRLLSWLLGIVHHLALKSMRHLPAPLPEEMESILPAADPSPEEQAQSREQADWVRQGLQSLSPEHRAVLELVFYQGLNLTETAKVCGCPVGTIKSRLSYARQQLRGALSRTEDNR